MLVSILAIVFVLRIYTRFLEFLVKHKEIFPNQLAFQKNILTPQSMLDVLTASYKNIQDNYTSLVLIDLRKAFDTASHPILLSKLENYSI